jgi:heterodisulfide reductase subunit A
MDQPEAATEKAKDLVRMAINKARKIEPIKTIKLEITQKALVIGGGISGMTAALNLADQEFETYLVEREDELGGHATHIYKTLEGRNVQEYLSELREKINTNEFIHVYTNSEIMEIEGYIGNFTTVIGQGKEKIERELEHGVIITATGAREYEPRNYLYGKNDNVIKQSKLEELLHTSDTINNKNRIVMIQCVGSRSEDHPYCSKMCCGQAIKNALLIKKKNPDAEVVILFRDIRTYGFKEIYYRKAREAGVIFLRYDEESPPRVTEEDSLLNIEVTTPNQDIIQINSDLLVLSAGIVAPKESNEELAKMLKVPLNEDNFFLEAHVKLRPVDFATDGVFVAGLAHCPKPIEDSIAQSNAAVSRACTILSKDEIEAAGRVGMVDPSRCTGCGQCVDVCAYNAVELIEDRKFGTIASINEALCKGCGACSGNCRCSAIDILGFTSEQIYAMITGRL